MLCHCIFVYLLFLTVKQPKLLQDSSLVICPWYSWLVSEKKKIYMEWICARLQTPVKSEMFTNTNKDTTVQWYKTGQINERIYIFYVCGIKWLLFFQYTLLCLFIETTSFTFTHIHIFIQNFYHICKINMEILSYLVRCIISLNAGSGKVLWQ